MSLVNLGALPPVQKLHANHAYIDVTVSSAEAR